MLCGAALAMMGACRAGAPESRYAGAGKTDARPATTAPARAGFVEASATVPGLPGTKVRCVRRAGADIWVGTDGGLAVHQAGDWTIWTPSDGLPVPRVEAIDIEPATGDAWLGTWGGGLVRLSGGRFDAFTQFNSGLAGDLVFDVLCAGGRVWAATNGGLSAWDPIRDEWSLYFERRADRSDGTVVQLARAGGRICAMTWEGTVHAFEESGEEWIRLSGQESTPCRSAIAARHHAAVAPSEQSLDVQIGSESHQAWPVRDALGPQTAIGVIGPFSRTIALPGKHTAESAAPRADLEAVQRAAHLANQHETRKGRLPLAVVAGGERYRRYGWTLPEDELAALAARPEVVGIVGAVGTPGAVLPAAVETTEVPVLNVAPPEVTQGQGDFRWTFRCRQDEPLHARLVLDYLIDQRSVTRVALVGAAGEQDPLVLDWWRDHARRRGHAVVLEAAWSGRTEVVTSLVNQLRAGDVQAVLTWCDTPTTAGVIIRLRESGWDGFIVTGAVVEPETLTKRIGEQWGNVFVMVPDRYGTAKQESVPSHYAAQHLITAVDQAGDDRGAVREMLNTMQRSSLGEQHFERDHPCRPLALGEWQYGQWRWIRLGE